MSALPLKSQIIEAISQLISQPSLISASSFLMESSKIVGYTMLLINTIDQQDLSTQIKHSILLEIKNHIKSNWNPRSNPIRMQEKQQIKDSIIKSFIRSTQEYCIRKCYKDIITLIIGYQYRSWNPLPLIIEKISIGQNIPLYLHVLLAVAAAFQFAITEEERTHFSNLIEASFPMLLQLLDKNDDPQLIYLSVKFVWKACHYQISPTIKNLTLRWMPVLQSIIGSVNPIYDGNAHSVYQKGSNQFYYFHAKKWATRIYLRFIQKHAKRIEIYRNKDNRQFSQQWYRNFGDNFMHILVKQFSVNTTKKIRHFQLKCIQHLIIEREQAIQQYTEVFQYDILIYYLIFQRQDENLAIQQPTVFLQRQSTPYLKFTQIKHVATNVWIGFTQLGSKTNKKTKQFQPGPYLFKNISFLKGKLQGCIQKQQELALYLLYQMRNQIKTCKQSHQMIKRIIVEHVISNFNNLNILIRARALDVFSIFAFIEVQDEILDSATEGLLYCLLKEKYILVRLKAISALSSTIKLSHIKSFFAPFLKEIAEAILNLIQDYGQQKTANNLQVILSEYNVQIIPFAYDLICRLSKVFFKMIHFDQEHSSNQQYYGQAGLAAAKCLKSITIIIQLPLPQEDIQKIQTQVLLILQNVFLSGNNDYVEDLLVLLNVFLFKMKAISQHLWFYFQIIIYNITGAPKSTWFKSVQITSDSNHNSILSTLRNHNNIDILETSLAPIRNFIYKISTMTSEPVYIPFKNELISLIFYLVSEVYKLGPNQFTGQLNIIVCTTLLISLLENFQKSLPPNVYTHIWEFSKINLLKFKPRKLKSINSQLIGLLLWIDPINILNIAERQNLTNRLITQITTLDYEHEYERARVILGLNQILLLSQKPPFIISKIPNLFRAGIKLVQKNIDKRLLVSATVQPRKTEEDQSFHEEKEMDYDDNDDDDSFWQQNYDDHYNGPLNLIDEVWRFQQTLQKLNTQQNNFYTELVRTFPAGKNQG